MLYADYFADDPSHDNVVFQRRFRMDRKLFPKIMEFVREFDDYFKGKKDRIGTVVVVRMFAYGALTI